MRKHLAMVALAFLVVLSLVIYTVAFQVNELKDIAVVTTFGKTTEVLNGRDPNEAGLQFKWIYPVQETIHYDARTFLFEDTYDQIQTQDAQNILLTLFCAWRIAEPAKFLRTIKTVEGGDGAEERIRKMLRDAKQDVIGRQRLADLINTDPAKMHLAQIEDEIAKTLRDKVGADYGIEIVMVGVKSLGMPESVTDTVINSMKEERGAKVQAYRSYGEAQATAIRERAKAASEQIIAFARHKEQVIRAEGDAAAAQYYSQFGKNEGLAMFLRSLEGLRKELQSRSVILLDSSKLPALDFFRSPVSIDTVRRIAAPQPQAATAPAEAAPLVK